MACTSMSHVAFNKPTSQSPEHAAITHLQDQFTHAPYLVRRVEQLPRNGLHLLGPCRAPQQCLAVRPNLVNTRAGTIHKGRDPGVKLMHDVVW